MLFHLRWSTIIKFLQAIGVECKARPVFSCYFIWVLQELAQYFGARETPLVVWVFSLLDTKGFENLESRV